MPTLNKNSLVAVLVVLLLTAGCKSSKAPVETVAPQPSEMEGQAEPSVQVDEEAAEGEPLIYRASRPRVWDLLHTRLEVSFDWENRYVNGIAVLELTPLTYAQESLVLDAKGFDILKIGRLQPDGQIDLVFDYDGELVEIILDREIQKDERIQVRMEYIAKPDELEPGGSEAITSDKGLYFINPDGSDPRKPRQIWTQGETEANSAWFPTIDAPNERCTQEMYITVDDAFKTLSNGVFVYSRQNENGTHTDYWKMDQPHAPYLFMMAIGEYSVIEEPDTEIPIDYWVEPAYAEYADDIFGNTPEMMAFFSDLLEYPYPWPKYSQVVVRDYVSGAMENTTASVFMEDLQLTDRELLDEDWDYIIAHELMHQWFGDLVTCESWSNLALNEGFANYAEYLWNEYKHGQDEADYSIWVEQQKYLQEAETKQVPIVRYYYDHREDMFDNHSYAKAGAVLHMLRKYVGDAPFFDALNHYLKANAFQAVELSDLRKSFEAVTGEDLNWFFDQWFLSAGHPVLNVTHQYKGDSLHVYVNQVQDTENYPVFKMPVYLDVFVSDEIDRYALVIEEVAEQYSFYYPQQPDLVLFDSEQQLVGEIFHQKTAEELFYQFNNAQNFLTRFFALYEIQETLNDSLTHEVIKASLEDPFWRMRLEALDLVSGDDLVENIEMIDRVKALVNDDQSLVRASALAVLSQSSMNGGGEPFRRALADSSYSVVGAALSGLLAVEEAPDASLFESQSDSENINILIPVADYYLALANYEQYDWFAAKTEVLQGEDLYFFLQYFSIYLLNAPEDQRKSSLGRLEELAIDHHQFYVRLAAFQGLMLLSETEGAGEILTRVKESEKDPRLVEFYSQY